MLCVLRLVFLIINLWKQRRSGTYFRCQNSFYLTNSRNKVYISQFCTTLNRSLIQAILLLFIFNIDLPNLSTRTPGPRSKSPILMSRGALARQSQAGLYETLAS